MVAYPVVEKCSVHGVQIAAHDDHALDGVLDVPQAALHSAQQSRVGEKGVAEKEIRRGEKKRRRVGEERRGVQEEW